MPSENMPFTQTVGIPAAVVGLGGGMVGMALKDMPGMLETANVCGKTAMIALLVNACCLAIDSALKSK